MAVSKQQESPMNVTVIFHEKDEVQLNADEASKLWSIVGRLLYIALKRGRIYAWLRADRGEIFKIRGART